MLVDGPAVEHHLLEQAGVDHFGEGAIDGGPTGPGPFRRLPEVAEQLVGVEVFVTARDVVDDHPPLSRDPLAAGLQKLGEPLRGRERHIHAAERIVGIDRHRELLPE